MVQPELVDHVLCLDHFLSDIQERSSSFARQLSADGPAGPLRRAVIQFIMVAAAKIALIGTENPPKEQLLRGRLLNAMLMLAELREHFDKAAASQAGP